MTINRYAFAAALKALGNAEVLIAKDFTKAGSWQSLGAKEGAITENTAWTMNELTAPENTGGIPHQANAVMGSMALTVPIIAGDTELWDLIEPIGRRVGVSDNPTDVVEFAALCIPRKEIDPTTGVSYTPPSGTSTVDAAIPFVGNAGNGVFSAITGVASGIARRVYVTMLTATTFKVTTSDGLVLTNGTTGTPYTSAAINFTLTAGGSAFVANDGFMFRTHAGIGGWAPVEPQNWLFMPRCYATHGDVSRPYDNAGKSIIAVTIHPMYYAAGPVDKRVYTRGDPIAEGYSTFKS